MKTANRVVRWQILSAEPDKTATFYQRLFAWTLSKANSLGYRELKSGVKGSVDGGVWPAPGGEGNFVQLFVEVEDVDQCIAEAEKLGGKVLMPKSVLPDGDVMAVLQDPTGLSFGVCTINKTK
ncbi:MAG: VOC family protein [Chthoniobacterales bacterium]